VDHLGSPDLRWFTSIRVTAGLLADAALAEPGIAAVEIHHKANRASAGVPRKLGYRFVGEAPDGKHAPADVGIYSSHKPATSGRPG
jgi:hypothetical protein